MMQPVLLSTFISAASLIAFRTLKRKIPKTQTVLRIRRLDPS